MTPHEMQRRTDRYLAEVKDGLRNSHRVWKVAYDWRLRGMAPVAVLLAPEAFLGPFRAVARDLQVEGGEFGPGSYSLLVKEHKDVVETFGRHLGEGAARHVDSLIRLHHTNGVPVLAVYDSAVDPACCEALPA